MLSFQSRNYAPMTPLGDDFDKKHKSFRLKSAKTQDTSWLFTVVGRHCPVMRVICSMRCGQYRSHFHQSVQWCQSKNKGRKLQESAIRPLITKNPDHFSTFHTAWYFFKASDSVSHHLALIFPEHILNLQNFLKSPQNVLTSFWNFMLNFLIS